MSYTGNIYYINATAPGLLPPSIKIIRVSTEKFMATVFWVSAITAVMPALCELLQMLAHVGLRGGEREKKKNLLGDLVVV